MRTVSVELSFDPASETRLRSLWTMLQREYPMVGSAALGVRPHVSLAVFRQGAPSVLPRVVAAVATALASFPLQLLDVDAFRTSEGVVYLTPGPSAALEAAHRELVIGLGEAAAAIHAHYQPGRWRSHCTIATGVPVAAIDRVIDRCLQAKGPGTVTVCRIGMVQYQPPEDLSSWPLAGAAGDGPVEPWKATAHGCLATIEAEEEP
ncbi:MAG: 2'-5' RNA ligase family protein [Candidatus Latescibacterota bacterium]|jgi:hypothetical protein